MSRPSRYVNIANRLFSNIEGNTFKVYLNGKQVLVKEASERYNYVKLKDGNIERGNVVILCGDEKFPQELPVQSVAPVELWDFEVPKAVIVRSKKEDWKQPFIPDSQVADIETFVELFPEGTLFEFRPVSDEKEVTCNAVVYKGSNEFKHRLYVDHHGMFKPGDTVEVTVRKKKD